MAKFLSDLLIRVFWGLLERLGFYFKKQEQDKRVVKEEGDRAEEAAEQAVSDVTNQPFEKQKPGEVAPIKESPLVRTVKKSQDWFARRRNRKRP